MRSDSRRLSWGLHEPFKGLRSIYLNRISDRLRDPNFRVHLVPLVDFKGSAKCMQ